MASVRRTLGVTTQTAAARVVGVRWSLSRNAGMVDAHLLVDVDERILLLLCWSLGRKRGPNFNWTVTLAVE